MNLFLEEGLIWLNLRMKLPSGVSSFEGSAGTAGLYQPFSNLTRTCSWLTVSIRTQISSPFLLEGWVTFLLYVLLIMNILKDLSFHYRHFAESRWAYSLEFKIYWKYIFQCFLTSLAQFSAKCLFSPFTCEGVPESKCRYQ